MEMRVLHSLLAAGAILASVGVASAAEPVLLTTSQPARLADQQMDQIVGGVNYPPNTDTQYGIVSAEQTRHGGPPNTPYPFTEGTVVPDQAAASYYNPSFVADGLYTAGRSPYGNGNPAPHVGNRAP